MFNISFSKLQVVLILLTISAITKAPNRSEAGLLNPKAHVTIMNDLRPGLDMSFHCKSKDTDFGPKVLPFESGNFTFVFRPNFWLTTLFFCSFQWSYSPVRYFNIYACNRDYNKCHCNTFVWKISVDGPCMFDFKTQKYDLCYSWDDRTGC